jgi:hypothetical protein
LNVKARGTTGICNNGISERFLRHVAAVQSCKPLGSSGKGSYFVFEIAGGTQSPFNAAGAAHRQSENNIKYGSSSGPLWRFHSVLTYTLDTWRG